MGEKKIKSMMEAKCVEL